MIQDLKKQRLKIVIWSTAVIQDLPSSIISRDGHFTILQFVTKQIWTQIPDTDMNMGRRWKKYMPSLTLYQRFSTGGNSWRCEMQCLGAAVLWVAVFEGFRRGGAVGSCGKMMMAGAIKRQKRFRLSARSAIWTIENFEEKAETGEKCLPVRGCCVRFS